MSSVTAITAVASKIGGSQYAATKKAIISMTETAAIEYIPGKSLTDYGFILNYDNLRAWLESLYYYP